MIEIKIINPDANSLNEVFGISEERRLELSAKMDKSLGETDAAVDIQNIGKICDTIEEFACCVFVHSMLLAKYGVINNLLEAK